MTTDTADMTDATDGAAKEHPTSVEVTFNEMYVLTAEDVDAFAINWNEHDDPPPYYIVVDGKRFAYTGLTFLVRGYGAALPKMVREEEEAGHLMLFLERDDRLLAYMFDPDAEVEDDE